MLAFSICNYKAETEWIKSTPKLSTYQISLLNNSNNVSNPSHKTGSKTGIPTVFSMEGAIRILDIPVQLRAIIFPASYGGYELFKLRYLPDICKLV